MGGELMVLGAITIVLVGYRKTKPIRQAKALLALHGKHTQEPTVAEKKAYVQPSPKESVARRVAGRADYHVTEVFAILEEDLDGEWECLFKGKFKGLDRGKVPGETTDELYRAVVRGDETGYVLQGW